MAFLNLTSDHPTAYWNWTYIANTKNRGNSLGSGKLLGLQDIACDKQPSWFFV